MHCIKKENSSVIENYLKKQKKVRNNKSSKHNANDAIQEGKKNIPNAGLQRSKTR